MRRATSSTRPGPILLRPLAGVGSASEAKPVAARGVTDPASGNHRDQPPRCGRCKSRRIGGRVFQAAALRVTARRARGPERLHEAVPRVVGATDVPNLRERYSDFGPTLAAEKPSELHG